MQLVEILLLSSLILLFAEKLEDANEKINEIEEELKGVVRNVLVASFGLQNHDLRIVNSVA